MHILILMEELFESLKKQQLWFINLAPNYNTFDPKAL